MLCCCLEVVQLIDPVATPISFSTVFTIRSFLSPQTNLVLSFIHLPLHRLDDELPASSTCSSWPNHHRSFCEGTFFNSTTTTMSIEIEPSELGFHRKCTSIQKRNMLRTSPCLRPRNQGSSNLLSSYQCGPIYEAMLTRNRALHHGSVSDPSNPKPQSHSCCFQSQDHRAKTVRPRHSSWQPSTRSVDKDIQILRPS